MAVISIIIPIYYNENELIPLYYDMKEKALDRIIECGDDYELILVDDGSCDNSWNEMNQIFEMDSKAHLYHLSRNFGEHSAILCGLEHSSGDCAINKAADLQEPSELILDMFEAWKNGNNVVIASREGRDEGILQTFFANLYYSCARKLAFPQMPKGGFNIFLLDRKAITVLLNMDETNMAIEGQILWMGFKSTSVPYYRQARKIGKSRWTFQKKVKCFMDMMFANSAYPIQIVGLLGGIACFSSLILAMYYIIIWFKVGEPVEGWTSLFVLVLLSFGITMITLSILGNYIWRSFECAKKRPVYIIETERNHN